MKTEPILQFRMELDHGAAELTLCEPLSHEDISDLEQGFALAMRRHKRALALAALAPSPAEPTSPAAADAAKEK